MRILGTGKSSRGIRAGRPVLRAAAVGIAGILALAAVAVPPATAGTNEDAAQASDACGSISYDGTAPPLPPGAVDGRSVPIGTIELEYRCTGPEGGALTGAPQGFVVSWPGSSKALEPSDWTLEPADPGQPARTYRAAVPVVCLGPTSTISLTGPHARYERQVTAADITAGQQPGCSWPATAVARPVVSFDTEGRLRIDATASTVNGRYHLRQEGSDSYSDPTVFGPGLYQRDLGPNPSGKDIKLMLHVTSQLLDKRSDFLGKVIWRADPQTYLPANFSDVREGDKFSAEIEWMARQGISTGWSGPDGRASFHPLRPVARDAMAAFMHRLVGSPGFIDGEPNAFADISPGQQFYSEINWLATRNVSTGWAEPGGTRTYRALQPVNRDAMAAFLYRLAGTPAYTPPAVSPFADVSSDQDYYREMSWLASTGISTGWDEPNGTRTFRPLQPVNRDAMAAFMYRYFYKVV